jgi:hypothetical protein
MIDSCATPMITSLTETTYTFRSVLRFRRASCFCEKTPSCLCFGNVEKSREEERKENVAVDMVEMFFSSLALFATNFTIVILGLDYTSEDDVN